MSEIKIQSKSFNSNTLETFSKNHQSKKVFEEKFNLFGAISSIIGHIRDIILAYLIQIFTFNSIISL